MPHRPPADDAPCPPEAPRHAAHATLVRRFEQQAAHTPEAFAARCALEVLTYAELNSRANRLAHRLRPLGAGPGAIVGIGLPRSLDMLVAVLGVLKSGAAYLPLDPAYPAARLSFMLEDAGCGLLIGTSSQGALPAFDGLHLLMDMDSAAIASAPDTNPAAGAAPDDLAYVIYTSGSTGRPKGVEVTHRNVAGFLDGIGPPLKTSPADIFFSVASLSFDMSVLDLFLPLCSGAGLVLAPREVASDPWRLLPALMESGATVLQATPATWKLLVDAGLPRHGGLTALVGGDTLPQDLAEALRERLRAVWNLYGPTEATVYATASRYLGGKPLIGRPMAGMQAWVLDPQGHPAAAGEAGELHIAGRGVARGYRHRPELTAQRFVPDPSDPSGAARMYKTGDLARDIGDGQLECLGRIDRQVKVRGHRVELGEIEALLRQHPRVRDAVVVSTRDSDAAPGALRLAAYHVNRGEGGGGPVSERQLRDHLLTLLPEFMVPSVFVRLDALPLSPNGKVDRGALPSVALPSLEHTPGSAVPAPAFDDHSEGPGRLEDQIRALWCKALRRPAVGPRENFFLDLGGNSLTAVSLIRDLERHFGRILPLDALWLEGSTVEGMARLVRRQRGDAPVSRLVTLKAGAGEPPLFVLHTMRGSVNEYQAFASRLPGKVPVVGVRSRGLEGDGDVPAPSIAQYAHDAARAIRRGHPQGPYRLAGYSIGGLIALEVARRLHAQGHEVSFLGLIDTPAPGFGYRRPLSARVHAVWRGTRRRLARALRPWSAGAPGGTERAGISRHALGLFNSLRSAEAVYRVQQPCPVPIDLFVAQTAAPHGTSALLGWAPHAPAGVRCHRLLARHHEEVMVPGQADDLARAIEACLDTDSSSALGWRPDAFVR